jgi:hypothetical protein
MASSSTNPNPNPFHNSAGSQISEKLTRDNFLLWKAQVMPRVRAAQFEGFLNGTTVAQPKTVEMAKDDKTKVVISNPDYEKWLTKD